MDGTNTNGGLNTTTARTIWVGWTEEYDIPGQRI